jgi:hypothetical protein
MGLVFRAAYATSDLGRVPKYQFPLAPIDIACKYVQP